MNKDDDVTLIPVAIASQAAAENVATIPATQATAGDGRVSIDLGYPPECAISVAAGGKYPEMQDANGVYRLLSSAIRSIQSWGILPFNADFAAGIGGYPWGALVRDSSGIYWVSTADNNGTTPGASGAAWQSLFAGYITQAQSDARYLMLSSTALQTVTGPVTFSGNLSKDAPSGSNAQMQITSGGSYRWNFGRDASTETGTSTGSNFVISRFDNSGRYIDTPLTIGRETGVVSVSAGLIVPDITDFTGKNALNAKTADARYATQNWVSAGFLRLSDTTNQTVTGPVTFSGNLSKDAPSGSNAQMQITSGGSYRWNFGRDASTETGTSTGSNFVISRFDNSGRYIDTPLTIGRETGVVSVSAGLIVPDITDFTDENALNARTAEGRYVGKATSSVDYPPIQAGVNKTTGNPWLSYNDGSGVKFAIAQQAGDYATNTALNTEITNRTNADTNLDNTKVNRAGDTMRGSLTIQNAKTTTTTGQYNYTPNLCLANTNGVQAYVFGQDQVNTASQITFRLDYNGTNIGYWWLNQNGGITSSIKGDVLFASDAAALYATFAYAQGTVGSSGNDWFWMKLPNGWIIQGGNASYYAADGTTGTTIKLPTSFGAQFVIAIGNDIGSNANAVSVMRIDASTIRLLGREVTGGTLSNTTINYLCVGTAP